MHDRGVAEAVARRIEHGRINIPIRAKRRDLREVFVFNEFLRMNQE
jgi:hypothetical protein